MDNPRTYYAFELLYWCGIREGELLALTPDDFDFENNRLSITKSYQRIDGKDIITPPKTQKSIRIIDLPEFLAGEIQDYMKLIYDIKPNERLFKVTKSQLYSSMKRGAARAGVKKIRVHDLRHSHISLLIQQGFTAIDIGNRVGHEAIDITYRYAHMFPDTQKQMAENLNNSRTGGMTIEREKSED